jgi:hypothetical protein
MTSLFTDSNKTELLFKKNANVTFTSIGSTLSNEYPITNYTFAQNVPDSTPTDLTSDTFSQAGNTYVSKEHSISYPYLFKYTNLQLNVVQTAFSYTVYVPGYTGSYTNNPNNNLLANSITSYIISVKLYTTAAKTAIGEILQSNTTTTWNLDPVSGILTFYGDKTRLGYGNPFITFWRYEGTFGSNSGSTGPTGPAGTNGSNGPTGLGGPTGPAGTNGVTGPTGMIGPTGPAATFSGSIDLTNVNLLGTPTTPTPIVPDADKSSNKQITNVEYITNEFKNSMLTDANDYLQLGNRIFGLTNEYAVVTSLSYDGNILAVGSPGLNGGLGICRVYSRNNINNIWEQIGSDIVSTSASYSLFGNCVTLAQNGTTLLVSSNSSSSQNINIVYKYSNNVWTNYSSAVTALTANRITSTISENGQVIAVGNSSTSNYKGSVNIYTSNFTLINNIQETIGYQLLAYSMSLSYDGSIIALGGPASSVSSLNPGLCRVYLTSTKEQIGIINGVSDDDRFGYSVSLSSNGYTLAVGAPYIKLCNVYVYDTSTTIWTPSSLTDIYDNFGNYVNLSSDGTILAVASTNAVCIYYYNYYTTSWIKVKVILNILPKSLSLSSNGYIFSIGESYFSNGTVKVFKLSNSSANCIRGNSINIGNSDTTTLNFYSSSTNPSVASSQIVASGGTSIANGGTIDVNAALFDLNSTTTTIAGTTTNLNSTTTTIAGTTTNLNSTTTNVNSNFTILDSLYAPTSNGPSIICNGDCLIQLTGNQTYTMNNVAWGTCFAAGYSQASNITISLSTTNSRDGVYFHVYNGGTGTITVNTQGTRLYGPSLTRGGQASVSIGSNTARYFRASTFINGFLNSSITSAWFTYIV